MRVWRVERSAQDIRKTLDTYSSAALAKHPDLVAVRAPLNCSTCASASLLTRARAHAARFQYWTFDEGAGRIVRDQSGHGNDLVLTHEPHWVRAAHHLRS